MSTSEGIYASEPAFPVLAHSLLSQPGSAQDTHIESESTLAQNKPIPPTSWDLKDDIDRGISPSEKGVFRCGTVIGFSRLRKKGSDDDDHRITQLPLHLLTTHIHKTFNNPLSPTQPTTFIIHPANYTGFAPQKLLSALLSPAHNSIPIPSRDEAIKRLDSVQLLPVYDFPSAVQAINEVSDSLHKIKAERDCQSQANQTTTPTEEENNRTVIFIIAGLDTLTEGIIRTSNPGKGAAVLTATLRTLTQLSRMHASFLSVLLVNTSGLGMHAKPGPGPAKDANQNQDRGPSEESLLQVRDEGVHSIFRVPGSVLLPNLLMRTLDQGIDTHLLMSSVRNMSVVEVIKDRVGDDVGRWCIWNETG